jgi:hypothetical protein
MGFLSFLAGKSGLFNIGCAVGRLNLQFPQNPQLAAREIADIMQQSIIGLANGLNKEDISKKVQSTPNLSVDALNLVILIIEASQAAHQKNKNALNTYDIKINEYFIQKTGQSINAQELIKGLNIFRI